MRKFTAVPGKGIVASQNITCDDVYDGWFVIDDTRSSRFYDFETMDEAKRLARYYNKKYNNILSIRDELKKSKHSTAFINEVLFQADELKEQGADRPDPYDLALKYFDEAYSDSEIENDLRKQGYSDEFIQRVFDKLDDVYQK